MRTASNVFRFDRSSRKLRSAKAVLRSDTRAGVREIITLAPVLGRIDPLGVPTVIEVMRNLIEPPDPSGLEREDAPRPRAKRVRAARTHSDAHALVESVSSQLALLDQILTARTRPQS